MNSEHEHETRDSVAAANVPFLRSLAHVIPPPALNSVDFASFTGHVSVFRQIRHGPRRLRIFGIVNLPEPQDLPWIIEVGCVSTWSSHIDVDCGLVLAMMAET